MDWARIKLGLFDHPKWIGLTPVQKGAWIELWGIASRYDGRIAGGRPHAAALLTRAGFSSADAEVSALIDADLIDEDGAGLCFHDWDEHQALRVHRGPSDEPDAKAERNRRNYLERKAREADVHHQSTDVDDIQRASASVSDRVEEIRVEENVVVVTGAPSRARARGTLFEDNEPGRRTLSAEDHKAWSKFGPEWTGFKVAMARRGFTKPPSGRMDDPKSQRGVIYPAVRDWPSEVARWIGEAPGTTYRDIIGYVLDHYHEVRDAGREAAKQADIERSRKIRGDWVRVGDALREAIG